jgi:trans-aconitate 2-methyltransferase
MVDQWDPAVYQARRTERGRPYADLIARIGADPAAVGTVVDLGCGEGPFTTWLLDRFPVAQIGGVDSSPAMIAEAQHVAGGRLSFTVGDVTTWAGAGDADVVVTNAVLQWVERHPALLAQWARELRPGAWFAMQVPGNHEAPSHRAIRDLMAAPPWRERLAGVASGPGPVLDPAGYAAIFAAAGCHVDAWESTYLHDLPASGSEHPVLGWIKGTSLRPVITALNAEELAEFEAALATQLAADYPVIDGRVWYPFRRIFTVANR